MYRRETAQVYERHTRRDGNITTGGMNIDSIGGMASNHGGYLAVSCDVCMKVDVCANRLMMVWTPKDQTRRPLSMLGCVQTLLPRSRV